MNEKEPKPTDRVTINLTYGTKKELDFLRYGNESFEAFLKKALPVLKGWRKTEIMERMNTLSK